MNPSKHITFNRESLVISASIADTDLSFVKKMDSMAHIYQTDNYFVIQCSNENYMISILSRLESNTSMIRKESPNYFYGLGRIVPDPYFETQSIDVKSIIAKKIMRNDIVTDKSALLEQNPLLITNENQKEYEVDDKMVKSKDLSSTNIAIFPKGYGHKSKQALGNEKIFME